MLSFLGRGKGGGESGGVGSASDPSSAAPRPDAPASNLAGADAVEISLQATLEGHTDRVWCVAWEPQGRSLATCSSDKTVRLWAPSRAAGGAWVTVAELEGVHNRTVRSVAWSPCGASVSRLNLTDMPLPARRRAPNAPSPASPSPIPLPAPAFPRPPGRLLATASFDASTAVWAQQGGEWECVAVVEGHENEVKSCAWSPSGQLLATCGRDKSVWIWELQPGHDFECVAVLNGHAQDVKQVVWHPTEDVLVSVSYDDTVKVWTEDPGGDDWSCTVTVGAKEGGHESTVWSAAFEAGTGRRMVTCSDDRTLGVWEAKGASTRTRRRARGDFPHRPRLSSPSSSSRYAPLDVRRLHRGGGAGQTVESDALQMRPGQHKLPARSNRGPGSPSRQNCNCGVTYLWTLQICVDNIRAEPSTPRRARSPGPRSLRPLRSTFVSPHSPSVSPALPHLRAGLPNMTVSPLFRFPSGHDRPTISVAWGACGVVAAGGGDNSLRCYAPAPNDPTQWRQIGAVEGAHEDDVNCVAWHPKETHSIATCSDDGSVKIWSVAPADARMA